MEAAAQRDKLIVKNNSLEVDGEPSSDSTGSVEEHKLMPIDGVVMTKKRPSHTGISKRSQANQRRRQFIKQTMKTLTMQAVQEEDDETVNTMTEVEDDAHVQSS